jgi:hypothetical protein
LEKHVTSILRVEEEEEAKQLTSMKTGVKQHLFSCWFLVDLFLESEDGSNIFP